MRDSIVLYVNGTRREVGTDAALETLADYLRLCYHPPDDERLTGTKIACAEGDCGACTVLVGTPDSDSTSVVYQSVDACIAFVFQMDGRHVVTVEGLRQAGGLTGIQQAMVDCHGSQCGFCTPGFVMAMHGMVEEQQAASKTQHLDEEDVRLGLSGNLCRCTGYLQILQAAIGVDLSTAELMDTLFDSKAMLQELAKLHEQSVCIAPRRDKRLVAVPRSLDDLLEVRAKYLDARLVAGATDLGVQHNHGRYQPEQVIATGQVPAMRTVGIDGDELVCGGAATWSEIDEVIADRLPEFHQVLLRFGSPQVRHFGTLAGNLANASPIADSIPFLMVAESTLTLASRRGARQLPIGEFYQGYKQIDLAADEVISEVRTPLPSSDVAIKLYKISKRRDMDISTVTAAFWFELDGDQITGVRVAVGGVGPTVVRLPKAEQVMSGAPLTLATFQLAGSIARGLVQPISDVRGTAGYRSQLVENLFTKCYFDLSTSLTVPVS
ncbi:xanthine dehydrogenase small subunit [Aeoliella sp.]|uniref:xanthine dehydrogenase small subunit n=1 Tax=Aeoliella sp. TaxID=2795800 RepID=UPI003CCBF1B8